MAPVWSRVYEDSNKPYTAPYSKMTIEEAWDRGIKPVHEFMSRQIDMAATTTTFFCFTADMHPIAHHRTASKKSH